MVEINEKGNPESDVTENTSNVLYATWKKSIGSESEAQCAQELYKELQRFSLKVVYITLGANALYQFPELVDDIVTEAFLAEPRFKGNSEFSTWFFSIARRQCLDVQRRELRRREVALDAALELTVDAPDADKIIPAINLAEITGDLHEEEKELIELRLRGWSHSEIAKMSGRTHNSVRCRWRRLLKKLRAKHPL